MKYFLSQNNFSRYIEKWRGIVLRTKSQSPSIKDKHLDEPEGVYVEAMALLLIDDAETGASGGILGIPGASTCRHLLIDEGDAHLPVHEAIVAISRCISARTRSSGNGSFRSRRRRRRRWRRWGALRKWRVAVQKGHAERVDAHHRHPGRRFDQIGLVVRNPGCDRLAGCYVLLRQLARRFQILLNDLEFFRLCKREEDVREQVTAQLSRLTTEKLVLPLWNRKCRVNIYIYMYMYHAFTRLDRLVCL